MSIALVGAVALSTALAVVPSAAFAEPYPCTVSRTFPRPAVPPGEVHFDVVHPDGAYAGTVYWNRNPTPGSDLNGDGVTDPGDALIAFDGATDSCGVEGRITSIGRVASTAGHNAPYLSPWASGDLDEDDIWVVDLSIVKGSWRQPSGWVLVHS
jgi:hypothetical protein